MLPFGLDLGTWLRSEVFGAGLYRRGQVKVGGGDSGIIARGLARCLEWAWNESSCLKVRRALSLSATTGEHSSGGLGRVSIQAFDRKDNKHDVELLEHAKNNCFLRSMERLECFLSHQHLL